MRYFLSKSVPPFSRVLLVQSGRLSEQDEGIDQVVEDYCWGV